MSFDHKLPLNGKKMHPLSAHALEILAQLSRNPKPRQALNPGVCNRLERENLVERVLMNSPYATHRGLPIDHLKITDAGRSALKVELINPESGEVI